MKKAIIPAAALAIALSSCLDNVDESTNSMTYSAAALVASTDAANDYTALAAINLGLSYNNTRKTVELSLSDLSVDGGTLAFTTAPLPYQTTFLEYGVSQKFSADEVASSGIASRVTGLEAMITTALNTPASLGITEQYGINSFLFQGDAMLMTCNIGEKYRLVTLPKIALYKGVTEIANVSAGDSEDTDLTDSAVLTESTDTYYRVWIDPAAKLATLTLFNPQGATEKYMYAIHMKDLPLTVAGGSYSVSASDVEYQYYNGAKWNTDDTSRIASLSVTPINEDLTRVKIAYTTPDGRSAVFSGTYLAD